MSTPRTDPVYKLAKPWYNDLIRESIIDGLRPIFQNTASKVSEMIDNLIEQAEQPKKTWAERLQEKINESTPRPDFPTGGVAMDFNNGKPETAFQYFNTCRNCGKPSVEHLPPHFKCPKS